jgi:hypothetical protein
VVERKALESPWAWAIGGALISGWLLGIFHGYDAHGRLSAAAAVVLPPYALYLAVEQLTSHPDAVPESNASGRGRPADAEGGYLDQCRQRRVVSDQLNLSDMQNEAFCTCSAQMLAEEVPDGESEYIAKHGENSPEFMALRRRISENCLAGAQSVGAPDAN